MTSMADAVKSRGARLVGRGEALRVNVAAAKALQDLMATNLGPRGTLKMLVGGDGSVRLTKDGAILIRQMQIKHPAASLIARAATAQDRITGDGTTTNILLIGEILRRCERYLTERQHPRVLVDGLELARARAVTLLDRFATPMIEAAAPSRITSADAEGATAAKPGSGDSDDDPAAHRELLLRVAQTALRTKARPRLADHLADVCVDAVLTIYTPGRQLDLHMVERLTMEHLTEQETRFVPGLVLDHGPRHPAMPTRLTNAAILTCNISLEFAKPVVNTTMTYSTGDERQAMVAAERSHITAALDRIVALKDEVCASDPARSFVLINEKGIDPPSLERLARAGIMALRRAKRRNMKRLTLACGGVPINHVDSLSPDVLGYAGLVYVQQLGDEKFTFVEQLSNPKACTILIKGTPLLTLPRIPTLTPTIKRRPQHPFPAPPPRHPHNQRAAELQASTFV